MGVTKEKTLRNTKKIKHKTKYLKNKRSKPLKKPEDCETDDVKEEICESDITDSSDCEEYEKNPRKFKTTNVRNLLPVKNKKGFIFRSEIVDENEEKTVIEQCKISEEKNAKTLVQKCAIQKRVLSNLKCEVALLCTSIVQDPENNIKVLKQLIRLMTKNNTKMIISEKKIVCFSVLHVFLDILPSYKIRVQEEKESNVQLKKSTKKLLAQEEDLLKYYKQYIDYLSKLTKNMNLKKKSVGMSDLKKKALYEVGLIALHCLCELLSTKFSFNFFNDICNIVVSLATNDDPKISDVCCDSFQRLFESDKLGEASYLCVKRIKEAVQNKKFTVQPNLLRCFFSLNLKEAQPEKEKFDMNKARKEWQNMSRKERYDKKKMKDLEAELRETEAQESFERVQSFHTRTLNKVFWIYFHILKDGRKLSLISPALEGLAKFAYLIDLKFFNDLNAVLCGLMESGKLSDVEKLHGVYTLFTILAGQAESLHIDPHRMYCQLYQGLLKLNYHTDVEHFVLSLKCLEYNILRKKRKISFGRILAFTKRLSTATLQTPLHGTLALLSMVRCILTSIKGANVLLDPESTLGSGMFHPEIEDPEHCNAQSTALWELHFLKKHYSPLVGMYAEHLLHNCPEKGLFNLPDQLSSLNPEEVLHLFADVGVLNKIEYLEDAKEPPKKKFRHELVDDLFVYEKDIDANISWKDVKEVNIFNDI